MAVANVISKGLKAFEEAPAQVQKQIEEGEEQGAKYLEKRGVKRQEIDQLINTQKPLRQLSEDEENAKQLNIPGYTEDVQSMNRMLREDIEAEQGIPGKDPYTKESLVDIYRPWSAAGTNQETYEEVGYKLPGGMLTDEAKQTKDHWGTSITAHVRRDTKDSTMRVFELQSDAQNQITKSRSKAKLSPYRIEWTRDLINRQLVDAANQNIKNVDFLIKPDGDYMLRSEEVQKQYEERIAKQIPKLAKKIKGPNGEKAKVEWVTNTVYPQQVLPDDAAFQLGPIYRENIVETKNPLSQEAEATIAEALDWLKTNEPAVYQDVVEETGIATPTNFDIFDTAIMLEIGIEKALPPEMAAKVANSLLPKVRNDKYLRVTLPTTAGGGVAAFSVPAFAEDQVQEMEGSKEANLAPRVYRAIKDGAQPSEVFKSLQESGYKLNKIQQALGPAVKPKVEQMRADGVPEDEILGIMQSIGIIPQAPYSDPTAEIDNVVGLQGPGQNKAVTETSDDIKPFFDPDEEVQLVERLTPTERLDAEAEMPKINPDLSPEDLVTNLRNITANYEQMGKGLVGWSDLSNKYKFEVKQHKEQINNLIVNELQKADINAVGVNEYGEVLVINEETGEPEPIDESILDSILASKYEIGGAITGGLTGARAGALIGGPLGAVGLGIIGSSIGAATGRGADVITAARDAQYELTTRELLAKMEDAGAADAVMGVVGGSAFQLVKGMWKTGKAAGRGLARGWDLFVRGNREGAMNAMIDNLGLSQDQAVEIIKRWEKLNDVKVLTKQARDTGKLAVEDTDTVLRVLSETTPGAEKTVQAAAERAKYGGSKLTNVIGKRANDLIKQAENATNDNIGTVVRENLDEHTAMVRDYFENVKTLGSESMKESNYRFSFDATTMVKKMREQAKGIHNAALRRDFYSYVDRIRELGNLEAAKTIGKQAKQLEKAKGLKNVKPKFTDAALEKANPYRDFNNLLELRKTVNKLRSDSRFKEFVQFEQMKTAMKGIDDEIARAARNHMPNGETWLRQWNMANTEYSKLKNLESNFLYKMITKGTATPEAIVKSMTKYAGAESPDTFMQVMGKLPGETRKAMEGAVYKHMVQNNTVGFEGGLQALHFPQLAKELDSLSFTQPEVRSMKRLVKEFAEVYKNDPHLLASAGNMPLPKFQSYLTDDPFVRAKYEFMSQIFNWVKARIPFSNNAGRVAAVQRLTKVLDNPLDATSAKKLLNQLGGDPALKTKLHELAIQYSKFGYPEDYGKVPVYRVAKPGDFNKASDTSIGRGVLFYTDKNKAKEIASQTGAKMQELKLTHKTIATPEDVGRILGYQPTKVDLQDQEVISKIKQGGWLGVAMDDKVIKFK